MLEKLIALFRRSRTPQRKLIRERLMKIIYNPFNNKWMWTKFNPASRTWEWFEEALPIEVEKYQDVLFPEVNAMEIISERSIDNG